ncbi:MAG TPA: DUF5719 family protein, partial [Acidimicrobiales bacterium]|nr:DUF5719 family protein [Acidimicrobiales bacterium]
MSTPPRTVPRGARHGRGRRAAEEATRAWRWPVILLVVAVLVGAGLIDRAVTAPSVAPPSPVVPAQAAPVDAQSSSWFCTGGSGTAGGIGNATLYLVNSGPTPVAGTVTVTNADGAVAARPVTVPARGQLTVVPSTIEQGTWLASRVDLDGGGVSVSELVSGADGWAQAPCSSITSASWYFASGATTDGDTLYVSLYNPTSTSAVVDLAFVTPKGITEPQPFEGVVVAPGQLKVAGVAGYVQDQASVATIVSARSGRVVATELEDHAVDGITGLSLRLGAPAAATRWYVPRTVDVTTGASGVTVLNPAKVPQRVTVHVELKSGSVAPFSEVLPADGTWGLATSQAPRIPANTTYAVAVT